MSGFESTITDFLKLTFLSMVPFVLASQGTMLGGRTGVFSVAQEGIMLVGAAVGFLVSYLTGSNLIGALVAMLVGGLFGLILAYFTTTLKMDQFVVGLALFFIGTGLSSLLPKIVIGVTLTPPLVPTLPEIPIPLLSQIPIIGPVLFKQNILVYFSILISIALFRHRLLSETLLEKQRLEQRNELLLNHANAILYTITPEGVFTYVSPNWTRLLGHPTDFVVGKNFSSFVLADDHPACFEFLSRVVQTGHLQTGIEYRVRHENGQFFWHTSSIMPVMDKQNQIVAYVGAAHDITGFKQAQEELRDANRQLADHVARREQELRDAIADTLVAAESEARRIGEDIHSGLCQDLVGLARLAESIEIQPDKACLPCRQTLDLIREQSARLAGVARAYSHDLALPELDVPSFSDALETLARRTEQLFHAEVEINANLDPAPFDRAQSVHVFRIVREAISNAVQHAHARHIWIDLIQESTQLVLSITNDGHDLPSPERLSAGLGLKQIRMRARLLDATFSIARHPHGKTVAELAIPKTAQESA